MYDKLVKLCAGIAPAKARQVNKYSQYGEEIYLQAIFVALGISQGYFVDFGAGDGVKLSNVRALIEKGWTGLMMDGNPQGSTEVMQEFITADNICHLFELYKVPKHFNLLSIDIDGNDYWVLESLLTGGYNPDVIIAEFNGTIPQGVSKTIAYNPNHTWGEDDYYGFSFEAGLSLGRKQGYTLIYQHLNTNLFFVRTDLLGEFTEIPFTYTPTQYHKHTADKLWVTV